MVLCLSSSSSYMIQTISSTGGRKILHIFVILDWFSSCAIHHVTKKSLSGINRQVSRIVMIPTLNKSRWPGFPNTVGEELYKTSKKYLRT